MRKVAQLMIASVVMFLAILLTPGLAKTAQALDCSGADKDSPACVPCTNPSTRDGPLCASISTEVNPISGNNGILTVAAKFVSYLVGVASIFGIIIGSIRYTTASGDANSVSAAKKMIIYSLIGIVVALFAQALVILVLK